jgi:exonuclease VII large subunit
LKQYFSKPIAKLEFFEDKILLSSKLLRQNAEHKREFIDSFEYETNKVIASVFSNKKERLVGLKRYIKGFDPKLTLSRGFSITRIKGEVLKSAKKARVGSKLQTELRSGKVISEVI